MPIDWKTTKNKETDMKKTLHLWVANQPEGSTCDNTESYIDRAVDALADLPIEVLDEMPRGAVCLGPPRIVWDQTVPDEEAWQLFLELRAQIAMMGHGDASDECDPPELVASLVSPEDSGAALDLQRMSSAVAQTWEGFVRAIR